MILLSPAKEVISKAAVAMASDEKDYLVGFDQEADAHLTKIAAAREKAVTVADSGALFEDWKEPS